MTDASTSLLVTGFGQLLLLFGSWSVLSGGIWKLFERIEKVLSDEARTDFIIWLRCVDFERRLRHVAGVLGTAFDSIYGSKHLSIRCFLLSALTSSVAVASLTFLSVALSGDASQWLVREDGRLYGLVLFAVLLNTIPDYLALLKTRWMIGFLGQERGTVVQLGLLVLDAASSVLIFVASGLVALAGLVVIVPVPGTTTFLESVGRIWWVFFAEVPYAVRLQRWEAYFSFGIFLYSTLATSVWVWLTLASRLLLRQVASLTRLVKYLRAEQPFLSLGFVSILIVTVAYLCAIPFVLFF